MTKGEPSTRIVIADDHPIFREGLGALLSTYPEFKVIGEANDGDEALKLVQKLNPDILLLDLLMPNKSGMEVLEALQQSDGNARTIVLSAAAGEREILKIFELGARGLVLKDSASTMLFKSLKAVMAGQYWIGRKSVSNLIQALKQYGDSAKNGKPANFGLTPREMEVIRAVISGYPNKEIASKFGISEQTVKHHITNIFDKLGVYNRLELTLFAFHHGIVKE
ncbi:MAG TPA: response regulator transcription factor [Acidobacteriota bacterium]|nr:response regulator transcription factor [Acidobacteriota bacterium]